MKQIGFITQGHSEYDDRLRALLDASGIDPEEFLGLEYVKPNTLGNTRMLRLL